MGDCNSQQQISDRGGSKGQKQLGSSRDIPNVAGSGDSSKHPESVTTDRSTADPLNKPLADASKSSDTIPEKPIGRERR